MVRITQTIEAAYEVESTYGSPPGSNLYHLGLLDTFDPRAVEMNITPVPSIGQSTDAHHASGPIAVSLPLKVACNGTGWKQLLGQAIGSTTIGTALPHSLTSTAGSLAVLARDSAGDHTLVTGVVPNEVTLEADYTTGGYITVDSVCTAYYSMDDGDTDDGNFNQFLGDDYSNVAFPSAPSAEPLLPSDLIVTCGPNLGDADVTASTKGISIDGPANSYVEVGEKYMRLFVDGSLDTSVGTSGVIDMSSGNGSTIGNGNDAGAAGGLTKIVDTDGSWTCDSLGSADAENTINLQKGIYKTDTSRNIFVATEADGTGYGDNTSSADFFKNLKTLSLKILNNNTSIPGRVVGDDNTTIKWLQNSRVARGKSDITLDLTMTAEDETWYDKYVAKQNIPLIRLDFVTI